MGRSQGNRRVSIRRTVAIAWAFRFQPFVSRGFYSGSIRGSEDTSRNHLSQPAMNSVFLFFGVRLIVYSWTLSGGEAQRSENVPHEAYPRKIEVRSN